MKKLISILLALVMIFSLAACGADVSPATDLEGEAATPIPTEEPDAEPTTLPTQEPNNTDPGPVDKDPKPAETEQPTATPEATSQPSPTPAETEQPVQPTEQPAKPEDGESSSEGDSESGSVVKATQDNPGIDAFTASTLSQVFSGLGNKNRVYSPLNVYLALAMLSDVTDGNSRSQVLNLLSQHDIDTLHAEARALIEANSMSEPAEDEFPHAVIIPAASFWLNDKADYNKDALEKLSKFYDADAFSGKMGSPEYTQKLRDWINERTNHLLEEQANGLTLDRDQMLALVTTLYFKSSWADSFSESATNDDTFHAAAKDETVPFMHKTNRVPYYRGEHFSTICLPMYSGAEMWILLPDEGFSLDDLINSKEATRFLTAPDVRSACEYTNVKMSIPKFDVSSDIDLCGVFAKLGVTDIFNPDVSDFTPLTDEEELYVSDIEHAARVKIDEEGCEAAAFTFIGVKAAGAFMPEEPIEFNCDRPFFFAVTGPSDHLLFTGAVNTILGK